MDAFIYEILILCALIPLSNINFKLFNGKRIEGKYIYLIIAFSILLCISGLRAKNVGSDTLTYYHYFEVIKNTSSIREAFVFDVSCPIYTIYEFILSRFFGNPQIITFFNSLVICYFIYRLILKSKCNIAISTLLFIALTLHYVSMNGTRQFMAVAIMANGLYEIIGNENKKIGIIFILIALGIHITSIIALIALIIYYFLKKKNYSFKMIYFGSIIFGLIFSFCINIFINIFASSFNYFEGYLDGSMSENPFSRDGGGRIVVFYVFLCFLSFLYYLYECRRNKHKKNFLFFIVPYLNIGLILGIMNAKNMLLNRINWYFLIFYIIVIPKILKNINKKYRLIIYTVIFSVLFFYCYLQLMENKSGIVPFKFYWE